MNFLHWPCIPCWQDSTAGKTASWKAFPLLPTEESLYETLRRVCLKAKENFLNVCLLYNTVFASTKEKEGKIWNRKWTVKEARHSILTNGHMRRVEKQSFHCGCLTLFLLDPAIIFSEISLTDLKSPHILDSADRKPSRRFPPCGGGGQVCGQKIWCFV